MGLPAVLNVWAATGEVESATHPATVSGRGGVVLTACS